MHDSIARAPTSYVFGVNLSDGGGMLAAQLEKETDYSSDFWIRLITESWTKPVPFWPRGRWRPRNWRNEIIRLTVCFVSAANAQCCCSEPPDKCVFTSQKQFQSLEAVSPLLYDSDWTDDECIGTLDATHNEGEPLFLSSQELTSLVTAIFCQLLVYRGLKHCQHGDSLEWHLRNV